MGFTAAALVDEYAFDLTPHGPKGHLAMPSTEEVKKFRTQFYAAQDDVTGLPIDEVTTAEKAEELAKRVRLLTAEERDRLEAANVEAVIEVCKGNPSREVIDALPAPVKIGFVNWVGDLLAPLF